MKFDLPQVKPFQCRFVSAQIEIQGTGYTVLPLGCGYQLIKSGVDEQLYQVFSRPEVGVTVCDCPDYYHRHRHGYDMCKHGRALVQLGFLDDPRES